MADYDLIVLGAGPGGYTAAIRAAQLGARTALIEKDRLGGVCLNWGCIPTKALYRSAKVYKNMLEADSFGLESPSPRALLDRMVARKNRIVDQLRQGIAQIIRKRKINYITGFGFLQGPGRVRVVEPGGARSDLTAQNIILATGTECSPHPVVRVDNKIVHDVKSVLDLIAVPKRLFVIGGGVSGCEFAQIFGSLGSEIVMTKRSAAPIKGLDADIEKTLIRLFKKRKYRLLLGDSIERAQVGPEGVKAELKSGQKVEADLALVTVGHNPLSYGIGLEEAGIALDDHGHVLIDEHGRTSAPNVYAIGDLTGRQLLAHFASHSGVVAVRHALGDKEAVIDEANVPKAVFTDPELAWVGLTEAEARQRHGNVKTGSFLLRALGRTVADGEIEGLIKIVAQGDKDTVVGVHILGPEASALIAEGTLAVKYGLGLKDLAETIHAHPTYPEAVVEAAEAAYGLSIHSL